MRNIFFCTHRKSLRSFFIHNITFLTGSLISIKEIFVRRSVICVLYYTVLYCTTAQLWILTLFSNNYKQELNVSKQIKDQNKSNKRSKQIKDLLDLWNIILHYSRQDYKLFWFQTLILTNFINISTTVDFSKKFI